MPIFAWTIWMVRYYFYKLKRKSVKMMLVKSVFSQDIGFDLDWMTWKKGTVVGRGTRYKTG